MIDNTTEFKITHYPAPAGVSAPPLSFATRVGDLLFVSGIPGFDEAGELPEGFDGQFLRVIHNLQAVIAAAGGEWSRIAKVNVLVTRAADVPRMNILYANAFVAPYPARTTCVVKALPNPHMLLEIECVADLRGL